MDGISAVVAERRVDNETYDDAAPSVLPHQLVRILTRDFSHTLQRLRERLDVAFSIEVFENIERQHKALWESYRNQSDLKSSIDSFDDGTAYRNAWYGLQST